MSEFSKYLTRMMGTYKMKKATFTKLMGATDEVVSKWTAGNGLPSDSQVFRIAELFGQNANFLLGLVNEERANTGATEAYAYLIKRVRKLTPGDAIELHRKLLSMEENAAPEAVSVSEAVKVSDWGKAVKIRLIEIDKNQEWLIKEVIKRTGDYFDSSYLHRLLTGKLAGERGLNGCPGKREIINSILGLKEDA